MTVFTAKTVWRPLLTDGLADRATELVHEIAEALRHRYALFLAAEPRRANRVRTASLQMINIALTIRTNTHERRRQETLRVAEAVAPPVGAA